jgi:hypothetical protein
MNLGKRVDREVTPIFFAGKTRLASTSGGRRPQSIGRPPPRMEARLRHNDNWGLLLDGKEDAASGLSQNGWSGADADNFDDHLFVFGTVPMDPSPFRASDRAP